MSAITRPISAIQSPSREVKVERVIRFAPKEKAKKAGGWAIKKYASVFRRLAE